jgi:hypothetical protein
LPILNMLASVRAVVADCEKRFPRESGGNHRR